MKIYHGIINKNLDNMLVDGVRPTSYWGNKNLALQYSDCGKIIEIESDDYEILPNNSLIEHFEVHDPEDESYCLWLKSSQTWQDSFTLFDSVLIEDIVHFNPDQIIEN